jgi:tetratricopeptide (TPR) repeat protein
MSQSHHPAIFVSYRRSDAAGHARALHRDLFRRFASQEIFFDRQSIESGDTFPKRLRDAVTECRVVLALISKEWLKVQNADGTRRLEDPKDFVRQEISQALGLDKKVIPVLFDDTPPPSKQDLPKPLKTLADCDALNLRGKVYEYDTQLAELVRLLGNVPGMPQPLPDPASAERYYRNLPSAPSVEPALLEQARQKLAQMPLDQVPNPCAPPEGSRLAFRSNKVFVGRQQDLKALARLLKGGKAAAIGQVAAATGLGGIGKTQLANEFAHRYGQFFAGGVYWLNFADPQAIPAEVAACSPPQQEGFELEAQVKQVLVAWQSALPRLLIFDNCEEQFLLEQWLPKAGASRVLVTSRRQSWDEALGVDMLPLGVLDRDESTKLLSTLAAHLTQEQANAIADELGDLPLALHMAGSFLKVYKDGVQPSDFLLQLKDKSLLDHQALKGRGTSFNPTQHELHVAKTFALSYEKLDPNDPIDRIALALLARAAWFAPGMPIPRQLLLKTLDGEDNPLDTIDGLTRLSDVGLIVSGEQGDLVLHRLLALYVQAALCNDDKARSSVETELLNEANRINNSGLPAGLIAWQPHLRFVTDRAMEKEDETGAEFSNTLGFHLDSIGDFQAARPYYEKALEIRKKVLGEEHPDTAHSLNNMGALLDSMGELPAARPYYEKALEINKKVLGEEHPDTAQSLNNMAMLCFDEDKIKEAAGYMRKALAIYRKVLGDEHPDTKTMISNLKAIEQKLK